MLKSMRGAAGSWVAKAFIAILVASFAAWGIGDIFISRHSGAVAMVGEREIDANRFVMALRNQMTAIERQIGRPLTVDEARQFGMDQAAIIDLSRQEAMFDESEVLGVSTSDFDVRLSIALNPAFQNALGEFDPNQYKQTLEFSRITPAEYETGQRRALASRAVAEFTSVGYNLPQGMAAKLHVYNNETRRFHYLTLDRAAAGDIPAPDDAALQAHLEAKAADFSSPEFRAARFVVARPDALAAQMSATEGEARELYEIRKSFYETPETRSLRRIVYKTAEEVEAAKAKLAQGASFEDLAAERGLSPADTDLGHGPAGAFEPSVAEAGFAAAETGVVGPVDTDFGPALLEVAAITPAVTRSFDDVREELEATVRHDKALEEILRIQTEMSDFIAGGADLDLIARNLGLEVGETPMVDAGGASPAGAVSGPAVDPAFLNMLFAALEGKVAGPVTLADDSVAAFTLTQVVPPALRPLAEVRDAVAQSLEAEQVAAALSAKAAEIVARLDQGELLAAEADALGQALSTSETMTRGDAAPDLPPALVESLFGKPAGGAAWAALDGGARATIAQVFEIKDPEGEESDQEKLALAARIDALARGDVQEMFTRAAVQARGVSVNASAVEQALEKIRGNAR